MNYTEYNTLNQGLLQANNALADQRNRLHKAQQAINKWEAVKLDAITSEINPVTGKAMYTNAEQRAAALTINAMNDPNWISMDKDLAAAHVAIATLEATREYTRNEIAWELTHADISTAVQIRAEALDIRREAASAEKTLENIILAVNLAINR